MTAEQKKKKKGVLFGGLGLGAILLAILGFVFLGGDKAEPDLVKAPDITTATSTTSPANETEAATTDANTADETTAAKSETADTTEAAPSLDLGDGLKVEEGNPVVATVDGKEVTRVDVYRFIQTMPANIQQLPAAAVYPMALEQVVNTRIVQNRADSADVANTDAFKLEMEMAKQQLARNLYLQNQVDEKISKSKLEGAYKEYTKKMPDVEERRARHILVETESKATAVIEKLNAGGKFEELAKELSTGPTGPKGGDLGYFADGEMVPEFSKAVFGMNKGDVTKAPVKTQFGYHVIKLEDVRKRPKPTLEQLTPALEAELRREILTELLQDWRKNAKIEQFDINGNPLKEGANALGIVPPTAASN